MHMRLRKHTSHKIARCCQVPLLQDQMVAFALRPAHSSAAGSGLGSDQLASLDAGAAQAARRVCQRCAA